MLGNYQSAINHSENIQPSSQRQKTLIKFYVYRAMVAQGNFLPVLDEVSDNSEPELKAVRLLADYLSDANDSIIAKVKELLKDGEAAILDPVRLVLAQVYVNFGDDENALRLLRGSNDLECLALSVQVYLRMNRPDLAEKELKTMQNIDDDHTCTQLATAWLFIAAGGDKYQDAYYIFHELGEKFSPTPMLLNSMAVCNIHMEKFEQAEGDLLDAMQKNNKDPDTLANMVVVAQHRGKSDDIVKRYLKQLETVAPQHAWLKAYQSAMASFDANKNRYSV